jgi:hypothetical protein
MIQPQRYEEQNYLSDPDIKLIESNKTAFYNALKLKDLLKFIREY